MAVTIQIRRDTAARWASVNPILADGEPGYATDTREFKIGDGVSNWLTLELSQVTEEYAALSLLSVADPGASAAGRMTLYAKPLAQRLLLKLVGPSGLDTALQPFLARNKIGMFCPPGNATTLTTLGAYTVPTAAGTATARVVATTNLFARMRRIGYVSAATVGALGGARVAVAQVTTGGAQAAGFYKVIRFGISDAVLVTDAKMFVGVSSTVAAPANVEPSTLTNCIGIGKRSTDTNLFLFYGGTTAQAPINLGTDFPANTINTDVYELVLFAPPNTPDVHFEVTRLNTGHVVSGTLASGGGVSLPSNTILLSYLSAWRCNSATAAAVGLDIMSDYIETDF